VLTRRERLPFVRVLHSSRVHWSGADLSIATIHGHDVCGPHTLFRVFRVFRMIRKLLVMALMSCRGERFGHADLLAM
jgi:hypothetical protein